MIYIRKAQERGHVNHGWLDTYHSFSFASYYDPRFMGFSALRVINEDTIAGGGGFGMHPHKDMEILTYIISGAIAHKDSMGNSEVLRAGEFQIMSAGTGIRHSEYNASETEPLYLYQIWIQPNVLNLTPRYEQKDFESLPAAISESSSQKQLILSPNAEGDSLKVYQDMRLWRYRSIERESITLEPSRHYYIQVVRGSFEIGFEISEDSSDIIESSTDVSLRRMSKESNEAIRNPISAKEAKPIHTIESSDGVMIHAEKAIALKALDSDNEILLFDLP